MSIDLKTLAGSPTAAITNTALLFGSANATAISPSAYTVNTVFKLFTNSVNAWTGNQTFGVVEAGNTSITGFANVSVSVNSAMFSVGASFVANTTGVYHTGTVNAASFGSSALIANSTGLYPTSNTVGQTMGSATQRWNITGGTGTFSSTLAAGNTTVTGFVNVSTNTFTLGTSSIAANGYSRLPNGLLYQWGTVSSNTTIGNITWPTAFATLFSVQLTVENATYNATYFPQLIASNTTTANTRTGNTTATNVRFMAIGV
jgi:hypothetical protein